MEKDFKIFGDKNFSDLSQEIYENSKLKKTQIELLVQEVHGYIQGIEDIAVVGPILKELLDVGVKNDDNLLKLATVFQRIMAKAANNDDDISLLSDDENIVSPHHTIARAPKAAHTAHLPLPAWGRTTDKSVTTGRPLQESRVSAWMWRIKSCACCKTMTSYQARRWQRT